MRYWGTVTASPSHPLDGQQFAFHNWDFKAASGTYGTYQPSHQVGPPSLFGTKKTSIPLIKVLYKLWISLDSFGDVPISWSRDVFYHDDARTCTSGIAC